MADLEKLRRAFYGYRGLNIPREAVSVVGLLVQEVERLSKEVKKLKKKGGKKK